MYLDDFLIGIAAILFILGFGSMAGAIEFGEGYLLSAVLILLCFFFGFLGMKEEGKHGRR